MQSSGAEDISTLSTFQFAVECAKKYYNLGLTEAHGLQCNKNMEKGTVSCFELYVCPRIELYEYIQVLCSRTCGGRTKMLSGSSGKAHRKWCIW